MWYNTHKQRYSWTMDIVEQYLCIITYFASVYTEFISNTCRRYIICKTTNWGDHAIRKRPFAKNEKPGPAKHLPSHKRPGLVPIMEQLLIKHYCWLLLPTTVCFQPLLETTINHYYGLLTAAIMVDITITIPITTTISHYINTYQPSSTTHTGDQLKTFGSGCPPQMHLDSELVDAEIQRMNLGRSIVPRFNRRVTAVDCGALVMKYCLTSSTSTK